ncbi:MAG: family transposase [Rhodospirillales bacterium]|nr:family transposase [Rhodospirillales bacterium]
MGVPAVIAVERHHVEDAMPIQRAALHAHQRHRPRRVQPARFVIHLLEEPHPGFDSRRHGRPSPKYGTAPRLVGHHPHDGAGVVLVARDQLADLPGGLSEALRCCLRRILEVQAYGGDFVHHQYAEIIRYEREHPGEFIHIDIKKLGRSDGVGRRISGDRHGQSRKPGTGWEYLQVAIDDASRLAFTAMMPDKKKESAVAFLEAAIAWFEAHGLVVQGVMTDNGSAYRSAAFAKAIVEHGLKHKRTRPYTPKTNGKAAQFIQTSIRKWAYATPFQTSDERTRTRATAPTPCG